MTSTQQVSVFRTPRETSTSKLLNILHDTNQYRGAVIPDVKIPQHDKQHSLSHENLQQHNKIFCSNQETDLDSPTDSVHISTKAVDAPGPSCPSSASSAADSDAESPTDHPHLRVSTGSHPGRPARSVRFRPRVRITSGINRHRHKLLPQMSDAGLLSVAADSLPSSSRSSSISVPLRSCSDDESNRPGWGPLGQRVSLLSYGSQRRWYTEAGQRSLKYHENTLSPNERTSLLRPSFGSRYDEGRLLRREYVNDPGREYGTHLSHEIDLTFGTWPGRLLNLHWWWWQLEPVVCCRCMDDSYID